MIRRLMICAALLTVIICHPVQGANKSKSCGKDLGQGWTQCDRDWWYTVTQGSRLLPLGWIQALELPNGRGMFLSDDNIRRFNYLTNAKSETNPYGLPVGFVVDSGNGQQASMCQVLPKSCAGEVMQKPWVGLNCSACHTNEITYQGKTLRVDGAPTLADFQGLFSQMLDALIATEADNGKFQRFADAVLGNQNAVFAQKLRGELQEVIAWEKALRDKNASRVQYGFGRLDAQGHILNKASLLLGVDPQLQFPADAPASYPHIWNAPQHDFVQWNGLAQNNLEYTINGRKTNVGALARNVGEVIGVFAQLDPSRSDWLGGYRSSVQLENLIDIERRLGLLQSPKWPQELGPEWKIKTELLDQGRTAFKAHCVECHTPLASDDLKTPIVADMRSISDVGTDLALACNTFFHQSKSGWLEGRKTLIVVGASIAATDSTATILQNLIAGSVIGGREALAKKAIKDLLTPRPRPEISAAPPPGPSVEYLPGVTDVELKKRAERCLLAARTDFKTKKLAYKARPLNGIWATAPYLHNGSVPTLYDLLLPTTLRNTAPLPAAGTSASSSANGAPPSTVRPDFFYVGSHEFDPEHVGFKSQSPAAEFKFEVRAPDGSPIFGNYNSGHEYGTDLSESDRRALVEYLKTL
ncbi:di-heme-cytochrome C peroxidase [Bradyrhizobium sp. USDA 4502]